MFLKFGEQGKDITYRIMILAICLIMLSLELIPICCATTGAVIIFERKNEVLGEDAGHVGVAIQLEDGSWVAGAVEGPGGLANVVGVIAGNGGWISDLGVFKTKEDVINEFAMDRTTYSNGIIPHDPYDKMVTIEVQNPNYSNALSAMENFPARGFAVWANNDCLTSVDDVLRAYNVEAIPRKPTILEDPNTYFYLLAADHDGWSALPDKKPNLASLLKPGLLSPLLAAPASDTSSGSGVSGTSGVSQTGTLQNDNYVMTKLRICNACLFPIGVPQNWDWMYNKNDGNYYTTYNGYYWVYDPQDRDTTMVNGVLMSSNPFPGSPPKYTVTSTAGVGPLV
jgi:hypothetical protein